MKFVSPRLFPKGRIWFVRWLYAVAIGHFIVALGMTWCADLPWLANYHQQLLDAFHFPAGYREATELQLWWMSLFGATLQAFSLFLLALVYCANRYRQAAIWGWLTIVILLWAPQDIVISLQKNIWAHVYADLLAVIALVPPLIRLWWLDRKPANAVSL